MGSPWKRPSGLSINCLNSLAEAESHPEAQFVSF